MAKQALVEDVPLELRRRQSTVLIREEGAPIVTFYKHTLYPMAEASTHCNLRGTPDLAAPVSLPVTP